MASVVPAPEGGTTSLSDEKIEKALWKRLVRPFGACLDKLDLEERIGKWGKYAATNPKKSISGVLCITLVCGSFSAIFGETERRGDRLWVPDNLNSLNVEKDIVKKLWSRTGSLLYKTIATCDNVRWPVDDIGGKYSSDSGVTQSALDSSDGTLDKLLDSVKQCDLLKPGNLRTIFYQHLAFLAVVVDGSGVLKSETKDGLFEEGMVAEEKATRGDAEKRKKFLKKYDYRQESTPGIKVHYGLFAFDNTIPSQLWEHYITKNNSDSTNSDNIITGVPGTPVPDTLKSTHIFSKCATSDFYDANSSCKLETLWTRLGIQNSPDEVFHSKTKILETLNKDIPMDTFAAVERSILPLPSLKSLLENPRASEDFLTRDVVSEDVVSDDKTTSSPRNILQSAFLKGLYVGWSVTIDMSKEIGARQDEPVGTVLGRLSSCIYRNDYYSDPTRVRDSDSAGNPFAEIIMSTVYDYDFFVACGTRFKKELIPESVFLVDYFLRKAWDAEMEYRHGVENDDNNADNRVRTYGRTPKSFADQIDNAVLADMWKLAIASPIILLYCSVNLGKGLFDPLHGMVGVGVSVMLMVIFSIVSGGGIAALFGVKTTTLNNIMYFLILGLGVDDSFVLTREFQLTSESLSIGDRCYITAKTAGVSIFIASLTDSLSFLLGSFTILPALRWFMQTSAFCVFFCFMYSLFFVVPVISLDYSLRVVKNKRDCCCCCPGKLCIVPEKKRIPLHDSRRKERLGQVMARFLCFIFHLSYQKIQDAKFVVVKSGLKSPTKKGADTTTGGDTAGPADGPLVSETGTSRDGGDHDQEGMIIMRRASLHMTDADIKGVAKTVKSVERNPDQAFNTPAMLASPSSRFSRGDGDSKGSNKWQGETSFTSRAPTSNADPQSDGRKKTPNPQSDGRHGSSNPGADSGVLLGSSILEMACLSENEHSRTKFASSLDGVRESILRTRKGFARSIENLNTSSSSKNLHDAFVHEHDESDISSEYDDSLEYEENLLLDLLPPREIEDWMQAEAYASAEPQSHYHDRVTVGNLIRGIENGNYASTSIISSSNNVGQDSSSNSLGFLEKIIERKWPFRYMWLQQILLKAYLVKRKSPPQQSSHSTMMLTSSTECSNFSDGYHSMPITIPSDRCSKDSPKDSSEDSISSFGGSKDSKKDFKSKGSAKVFPSSGSEETKDRRNEDLKMLVLPKVLQITTDEVNEKYADDGSRKKIINFRRMCFHIIMFSLFVAGFIGLVQFKSDFRVEWYILDTSYLYQEMELDWVYYEEGRGWSLFTQPANAPPSRSNAPSSSNSMMHHYNYEYWQTCWVPIVNSFIKKQHRTSQELTYADSIKVVQVEDGVTYTVRRELDSNLEDLDGVRRRLRRELDIEGNVVDDGGLRLLSTNHSTGNSITSGVTSSNSTSSNSTSTISILSTTTTTTTTTKLGNNTLMTFIKIYENSWIASFESWKQGTNQIVTADNYMMKLKEFLLVFPVFRPQLKFRLIDTTLEAQVRANKAAQMAAPGATTRSSVSSTTIDLTNSDLKSLDFSKFYLWGAKIYSGSFRDGVTYHGYDRVESLYQLRDDVKLFTTGCDTDDAVFAYASYFIWWEEVKVIKAEIFRNLVIAALTVIAMILTMLRKNLTVASLVLVSFVMSMITFIGFLHHWSVRLFGLVAIFILIGVGISVDYFTHMGHFFVLVTLSRKRKLYSTIGKDLQEEARRDQEKRRKMKEKAKERAKKRRDKRGDKRGDEGDEQGDKTPFSRTSNSIQSSFRSSKASPKEVQLDQKSDFNKSNRSQSEMGTAFSSPPSGKKTTSETNAKWSKDKARSGSSFSSATEGERNTDISGRQNNTERQKNNTEEEKLSSKSLSGTPKSDTVSRTNSVPRSERRSGTPSRSGSQAGSNSTDGRILPDLLMDSNGVPIPGLTSVNLFQSTPQSKSLRASLTKKDGDSNANSTSKRLSNVVSSASNAMMATLRDNYRLARFKRKKKELAERQRQELDSKVIAIDAIERIGPAVIHAVASTGCAIAILSTGVSFISLMFFKVLFVSVFFACLFGFLWLPVLLSHFTVYEKIEDDEEDIQDSRGS